MLLVHSREYRQPLHPAGGWGWHRQQPDAPAEAAADWDGQGADPTRAGSLAGGAGGATGRTLYVLTTYELETLPGLERFAADEAHRLGVLHAAGRPGRLTLETRASLAELHALRSPVAVHEVLPFAVPRPRALLGQQHLDRLVATIRGLGQFDTLRLSAAGADSPVLLRLRDALTARLRLRAVETGGDLLVALRRAGAGWELLIRTSPRPLSARAWRVCDLPGALNACAAHAMVVLTDPRADETFVNIACGSATLMIERLFVAPAGRMLGYDVDRAALECGRANVAAAGCADRIELVEADARHLDLESRSVRTVVADLPYAMLMGSSADNRELYPALLREAARVLVPAGRCVIVTTQHRLLESSLGSFQVLERIPFQLSHQRGVLNPTIYVLRKR